MTTQLLVDDWVPTVAEAPDGSLVVYFVSVKRGGTDATSDIYLARKRAGSSAWDVPIRVTVNSATDHDELPFVARMGNQLGMVWVRHDTSNPDFISNPKSELYHATSSDGVTWSAAVQVTKHDGYVVNLFPQLFQRHDGSWAILWLSTRSGTPQQYELPVSRVLEFPTGLEQNSLLPGGYSHRLTTTSTPGEYLAAWVQGPTGSEDIYYRFLKR